MIFSMMEFPMKDVTRITGEERGRIKEWIQGGQLNPSINRASGPGTRHLFNSADLYLIELFRHMTDSGQGWSRKVAGEFMRAIRQDDVAKLSTYVEIASGINIPIQDKIIELKFLIREAEKSKDQEKIRRLKQAIAKYKRLQIEALKSRVFLCFVREWLHRKVVISCVPLILGPRDLSFHTEIDGFSDVTDRFAGNEETWENMQNYLLQCDDSYIINFTNLVRKVDAKVEQLYPEMEY